MPLEAARASLRAGAQLLWVRQGHGGLRRGGEIRLGEERGLRLRRGGGGGLEGELVLDEVQLAHELVLVHVRLHGKAAAEDLLHLLVVVLHTHVPRPSAAPSLLIVRMEKVFLLK